MVAVAIMLPAVRSHAVMTFPAPRPGIGGTDGYKLQPFASAQIIANSGCGGGTNNRDPGVQAPVSTYSPGDTVQVSWRMTTPHPADNIANGIRVALHVSAQDSFANNILLGGVEGDPPYQRIPAGDDLGTVDEIRTETVQLPRGKTCDICTLQWVWSAQGDGGSYIGCTDISITANGQPLTPRPVPRVGDVLPGVPGEVYVASPPPPPYQAPVGGGGGYYVPPPPLYGGGAGGSAQTSTGEGGMGGGSGFILGLLVGIAGTLAAPIALRKYKERKALKSGAPPPVGKPAPQQPVPAYVTTEPPPPAGPPPSAAPVLPPKPALKPETKVEQPAPPPKEDDLAEGWTTEFDTERQRSYYYHTGTGEVTWTKPTSNADGPPRPPPADKV